ncbi:HAD family hydrolase [Prochlorococcus sp. MIT 1223]|uniref:HAD family hydrolase n=1 Tax=Prochlorococcus sp. MIT 1223 TaxID=3096217 RepID=UPI002A761168|nr:HAD hydrolase-like protein [Prochlorococcus sp. MIT 1223]
MTKKSLLVFDFDGVIIDGIAEYWSSSLKASMKLLEQSINASFSPSIVPESFKYLRPWVNHGWEMVIIATELIDPNSELSSENYKIFAGNYTDRCDTALISRGWNAKQLQEALDNIRNENIHRNLDHWLSLHKGFPGIKDRINRLKAEGIEIAILTTKSKKFTSEILNSLQISVDFLFGYEAGSKTEVLLEMSCNRTIRGFIEDRRSTLEKVLITPNLDTVPCFLASWGYLKPSDCKNLPEGIYLLEPKTFIKPLAKWH